VILNVPPPSSQFLYTIYLHSFEARLAVEPFAARIGCERASEAQLRDLGKIQQQIASRDYGTPYRRAHLEKRQFKPLLAKADLPRATRLHDLRHTAATLLLSQDVHPKLVQELLGHSSVAITLDRYSHFLPSMGDQTAVAMDAALS
jgi:integrase